MISPKPPKPWMTPDIMAFKRHRRYFERVWCRSPTALNRTRLTRQIHFCNKQMSKAKSAHFSKVIADHSGDHRSLWKAFSKILHCRPKACLSDHTTIEALGNAFSSFFINKIPIIPSSFSSSACSDVLNPPVTGMVLQKLTYATDDEVCRLVLSAPCKSSDLSTSLVKDRIDILVTPTASIVNLSLSERCFPSHFKSALVSPLLKKPTLNTDNLKDYKPVSNLRFLSKILEKVVANRLHPHIKCSKLSNHYQSAYKKIRSTKTALLKLHNHILFSMDNGKVTARTLLDLSAAFDTIDHTILLRRLNEWFGVTGKAVDWFNSYLTGRCQRINPGDCLSSKSDLPFGVPQGSVLGHLLFYTLYHST